MNGPDMNLKKIIIPCMSTIINNTNKIMTNTYIPAISSPVININYELIQLMSENGRFPLNVNTTYIPNVPFNRIFAYLSRYINLKNSSRNPANCDNIRLNVKSNYTMMHLLVIFYFSANLTYKKKRW